MMKHDLFSLIQMNTILNPIEDIKTIREKKMKDRITLTLCSKYTGTIKITVSINGRRKNMHASEGKNSNSLFLNLICLLPQGMFQLLGIIVIEYFHSTEFQFMEAAHEYEDHMDL
ncbi:hypothetical protein AYI68_g3860 [Smittium mucronatum]|uniref:Uncharacterized protein n=1 Tax=Smittium mucronatum TaxID=133383 RepID=A0A1R0GYV9_9FUNG|nr:hypothetical protein AYI68_g3860 [Smittium mucronatum]